MEPDEENLDFLNWLAESRQDYLSQTGILSSEEYMTEDLTALLGHEPTPDEKADLAIFLDKVMKERQTIYIEGVRDGIRMAKEVRKAIKISPTARNDAVGELMCYKRNERQI